MEAQIKEELKEATLCFETSGDNLASLSLIEKYDRFMQNPENEISCDGGANFFLDESFLNEEFAKLTSNATNTSQAKNHRLSHTLPEDYSRSPNSSIDVDGTGNGIRQPKENEIKDEQHDQAQDLSSKRLHKLIEELEPIRKTCGGNFISCKDNDQLESLKEKYSSILDWFWYKQSHFERTNSSRSSENDEEVDVEDKAIAPGDRGELFATGALAEKVSALQEARDRFYEVEQQIKEQVEQLELVERYKMESVG